MPCNALYMEPAEKEKQSVLVSKLICYVNDSLDNYTPDRIRKASVDPYGNLSTLDKDVAMLCGLIKGMSEDELNNIVYDGRNPTARKLADWWERHKEADRKRVEDYKKRLEEIQQEIQDLIEEEAEVKQAIEEEDI